MHLHQWEFQHYLKGKAQNHKFIWADTIQEAVSKLSDKYQGVFRLNRFRYNIQTTWYESVNYIDPKEVK